MRLSVMNYNSPFGKIYTVFDDGQLIELSINARPELAPAGCPIIENREFRKELDDYFAGRSKVFRQKTRFVTGTPFERKIWLALKKIPSGQTRSYKWIAEQAGKPGAARAAGQALGKNPLPIIVPCHRVIASDGSLGGFSGGGVKVKDFLLKLEKLHS
jgi:methylated-DNA-[protein]-cysteine S-methyltransferase